MATGQGENRFFLRRSADIERVKQAGHRLQTPFFNLVSCASPSPATRMGIIVGKRLGTAVVRNRAKRVFRELARQVRRELVEGRDVLVFPRRPALGVGHSALRDAWRAALHREGLLPDDPEGPCVPSASV